MSVSLNIVRSISCLSDPDPMIIISGKWLLDSGFAIGKKLVVEDSHGIITIKIVDREEV